VRRLTQVCGWRAGAVCATSPRVCMCCAPEHDVEVVCCGSACVADWRCVCRAPRPLHKLRVGPMHMSCGPRPMHKLRARVEACVAHPDWRPMHKLRARPLHKVAGQVKAFVAGQGVRVSHTRTGLCVCRKSSDCVRRIHGWRSRTMRAMTADDAFVARLSAVFVAVMWTVVCRSNEIWVQCDCT
jgi:hypothetical protein